VTRSIIAFAPWLLCICAFAAGERVRGGLTFHEVNGQVDLKKLGEDVARLSKVEVPITTMGLIECEVGYGSSVFFTASNRCAIYFEGSGSFAIERFEQVMPKLAKWNADKVEPSQSQMILNFRGGDLIVDNRNMLESSQFLVETPLGRLSTKRALWQMQILFDQRSQIFDFIITCTEGRVRFTDLQGQQYTVHMGQRLAGVGSRKSPSIEVGEKTERSREQMLRYQDLASQHSAASSDFTQYLACLQVIEQTARRTSDLPVADRLNSTRRPIVIEYAREAMPVTPFRGEVKPPSADQADLF
jgi:hypothetical protein